MKGKYKEEKIIHDELLELLKKHFSEDEEEMAEDEDDEEMTDLHPGYRDLEESGDLEYEGKEPSYGEDDEEEEEEEEDKKLSKDKRKQLSIMVLSKRAGKKRKAM